MKIWASISAFVVMEDRADRQVPLQVLEGFLDIP